jgi:hypothetical protein
VRKIGAERVGVRVCQAVLSLGWLAEDLWVLSDAS